MHSEPSLTPRSGSAETPDGPDRRAPRAHRGAFALLGPPSPGNPLSRIFLATKAALACALALALDRLTGNPDHVTSTFVAVLCVSPVLLMGLRRSLDQVAGSLLGGLCGTALRTIGLPLGAGLPLAVGASVLSAFAVGFGRGYPVAAFTALFVLAVPRGGPGETLVTRLLAVATAAVAAFAVNALVSSLAYRSIFERRLRSARRTVSQLLARSATEGPGVVRAGFPMLAALEEELGLARGELALRRSRRTLELVAASERLVEQLRRLLHLVADLDHRLAEEGLPPDSMAAWLHWLVRPGGDEPTVPEALSATTARIRRLGRALAAEVGDRGQPGP